MSTFSTFCVCAPTGTEARTSATPMADQRRPLATPAFGVATAIGGAGTAVLFVTASSATSAPSATSVLYFLIFFRYSGYIVSAPPLAASGGTPCAAGYSPRNELVPGRWWGIAPFGRMTSSTGSHGYGPMSPATSYS